jgi:hypothetical protein
MPLLEVAVPALAELALTATVTAADAWRSSSARWERRAEICLAHLEARSADLAGCQLLHQVERDAAAPVIVRPWGWWAGGAAAGAGVAAGAATLAACESADCRGIGGGIALGLVLVGLLATVAF